MRDFSLYTKVVFFKYCDFYDYLILKIGVTPKILQASFNVMLSFTLLEWLRKYILLNFYNYE